MSSEISCPGWSVDTTGNLIAVAYFTDIVYLSIKFATGNGDCAPFVRHNAFLRWGAMQSVRFTAEDGRKLF